MSTPPTPAVPRFAYRIVCSDELAVIRATGVFKGSELDHRDGYMHLSVLSEVLPTAGLYFPGRPDLHALQVELSRVPGAVIRQDYVASRNAFFPHIVSGDDGYAVPLSACVAVHPLRLVEGAFVPFEEKAGE